MMNDFGLQIAVDEMLKELVGETIEHGKATRAAISQDGRVEINALSDALLIQRVDFHIVGAATAGANVAQQLEVYQHGRLRRIVAHAKTAPTTAEFTAVLVSGATAIENVSIPKGQTRGVSNGNGQEIPTGGPLRINVSSAGGAADVTITVFYSVG